MVGTLEENFWEFNSLIKKFQSKSIFFICRISVIFRVKSALKIKLTDRHLLQRLAPILALYVVYLLAWSLAGPSHVTEMKMPGDLKFDECSIDWWDHAILICKSRSYYFIC